MKSAQCWSGNHHWSPVGAQMLDMTKLNDRAGFIHPKYKMLTASQRCCRLLSQCLHNVLTALFLIEQRCRPGHKSGFLITTSSPIVQYVNILCSVDLYQPGPNYRCCKSVCTQLEA